MLKHPASLNSVRGAGGDLMWVYVCPLVSHMTIEAIKQVRVPVNDVRIGHYVGVFTALSSLHMILLMSS